MAIHKSIYVVSLMVDCDSYGVNGVVSLMVIHNFIYHVIFFYWVLENGVVAWYIQCKRKVRTTKCFHIKSIFIMYSRQSRRY